MKSTTHGRAAAFILTLGLLSLAGCNRPAGESPMASPSTSNTPRTTPSMPDGAASPSMPSASSARL